MMKECDKLVSRLSDESCPLSEKEGIIHKLVYCEILSTMMVLKTIYYENSKAAEMILCSMRKTEREKADEGKDLKDRKLDDIIVKGVSTAVLDAYFKERGDFSKMVQCVKDAGERSGILPSDEQVRLIVDEAYPFKLAAARALIAVNGEDD